MALAGYLTEMVLCLYFNSQKWHDALVYQMLSYRGGGMGAKWMKLSKAWREIKK